MSEIANKQKGDNNTQIGEQIIINNNGLSPTEACQLTMDLFHDNFPKLQQLAREVVEERVRELSDNIFSLLSKYNDIDFNSFSDPDVQYMLLEAQKSYARFGEKEKLTLLTKLVADRIKNNNKDNHVLKTSIDKAASVIGQLSSNQLDFLSLLFFITRVKLKGINTIEDLKIHFRQLSFYFPDAKKANWELLNTFGCLTLQPHEPADIYIKFYGFEKSAIQSIMPESIRELCYDYYTSPVGTIIAIINAEIKTPYEFNYNTWIHD